MDTIVRRPAHDDVKTKMTAKLESIGQVLALAVQASRQGTLKTIERRERVMSPKLQKE